MEFIIKVCRCPTLFLILIHVTVGQQTNSSTNSVDNNSLGFMPGSSPATPTKALALCQSKARSRPLNVSYEGTYAKHIHNWCSTYNDVLPCLDRTLPTSNDITDWFLKLILNQSRAIRMSRSMCSRFPFISNLTCADEGMERAKRCMAWSTKTSIDQFYNHFRPGQPFTASNRKMASIYACITTVATAGCLHKELTACSSPQRKLIYDFYIMFSGKCREVAGLPESPTTPTTTVPNTIDGKITPDAIQIEDTKLQTALESEFDNKDNGITQQTANVTNPQSSRTESTTSGNTSVRRQHSYDGSNGQNSPCHMLSYFIMLWWPVAMIVL